MTRVTVIDDDQDVLDLLGELLEAYGYDVDARTAPVARIEELVELRPDLLIIDLRLLLEHEELSGLQTIHAARTSSQLREVPIVVCTADVVGLKAAWPSLMERGDIHQLTKPFDLRTFERVLAMATGSTPHFAPRRALGTDSAETVETAREG
jgi:CheY-like chemotaxis protein